MGYNGSLNERISPLHNRSLRFARQRSEIGRATCIV